MAYPQKRLGDENMKMNKKGQVFDQLGALGIGIAGLVDSKN